MINDFDTLKNISDPLKIDLLQRMFHKPKTGQMLAEELDMSRAKVHYHLDVLLNAGIIFVVDEKKIVNVSQKFYAPVAKKLIINHQLLDYSKTQK